MLIDGCAFMVDSASIFFRFVRVEGWFHSDADNLTAISIRGAKVLFAQPVIGRPHPVVDATLGVGRGFLLEVMLEDPTDLTGLEVFFETHTGKKVVARIADLCEEREKAYAGRALIHKFIDFVNSSGNAKILDIGGRARSGLDRSELFHGAECIVLDVLPGENVDVVGDAHCMSKLFPPATFDAMFSSSVFEHLLMPWVVAAEMSRVMKPEGVAFIATHHTIGLHDVPWDFWRFSDNAWDALFNHLTGFEILDRSLENPQYIVPHFMSRHRGSGLEGAVGYIGSAVLVRKIGEPTASWGPMPAADLIRTSYPQTTETPPSAIADS